VDVDPEFGQVAGHKLGAQASDFPAVCAQAAVGAAGRVAPPVRRAEALDAPTLLVDQDRDIEATDGVAQGFGQAADLGWGLDVAREEDEAPGADIAEEGGFVRRQTRSRTAEDGG